MWQYSLEENGDTPEIYVDGSILKSSGYSEKKYEISLIFDKVYEIDGRIYRELIEEHNKSVEFEIVLNKKKMNKSKMKEKYLDVDIKLTNYGIIINSNILVPKDYWHTILTTGEDLTCFVCDSLVDSMEHMESYEHADKLKNCKPLKSFDLSIVRKINEHYHCGICNEVFHKSDEYNHFKQKSHEENMLYATNRASDVLCDFGFRDHKSNIDNENLKEYHFNRNNIYRDNSSGNQNWENRSQYSERENQYLENRNQYSENQHQYLENNFGGTVVFRNSSNEYQDSENQNEYLDYPHQFSGSSDGFYEYDFNNDYEMEINGNNVEGFSYASMAKKPAVTPIYIDAGDFKVKFDAWHMVNELKENKFYCIVCNQIGHISQKARHCMEKSHVDKVNECAVVGKYKKCFIRQVGDRYHCALCNNIQPVFNIDEHLQSFHKNIHSKIDVTNDDEWNQETNLQIPTNRNWKLQESSKTPESVYESPEPRIDFTPRLDLSNPIRIWRQEMEVNNVDPSINNDFYIYWFNHCFRVSFLSLNVVLKRNLEYTCGICHLSLPERFMILHIKEKSHLDSLNLIPFELAYGINLIRKINHLFHCTLCNVFYDNWLISEHIKDPIHIELLEKAIKIGEPSMNQLNPKHDSNQSIKNKPNTSKSQETNINIPKHQNSTSNTTKSSDPKQENQKINSKNQNIESTKNKIKVRNESENLDGMDSVDKTDLSASIESEESMDLYNHDYIYLQLKTSIVKVTYNAYHSLVPIGDGTRYCFVCSIRVLDIKIHIESREHIKCMECKFLDKYEKHFLRQMFHQYHCSVCNVMFSKKYLSSHLSWSSQENMKVDKKARKKDFKLGIQLRSVPTQKEIIYLDERKSKIDIIGQIDLRPKAKNSDVEIKKKNKLVIIGGNVLKICWDAWQALIKNKIGLYCLLCERDIKNYDVNYHVNDERHLDLLEGTIDRKRLPHLVRQINDSTLNCVTCNLTLKKHTISDHLNSKKHNNNVISSSFPVESYTDCNDDVLYL